MDLDFAALDRLPMPLFRCNAEGTVTWVNEAWTDQLGAATGQPWHPRFVGLTETAAGQLWRQSVGQRDPAACMTAVDLGNGRFRHFKLSLQPVAISPGSETQEMLGCLMDITTQNDALAEMTAILDTAVDGIVIINQSGIVETFNQAACDLFGYQRSAVVGNSINMLMTEADAAHHDGYLRNYLKTGEANIIGVGRELTALRSDGVKVPIYLAVSEIQVSGTRRFAGIVRNLTEQQATREALAEQREKLAHVGRLSTMGEMTASIAHEINQPLTAISMYAQASLKLLEREDGGEKIRDALEKLNLQALRAGAVIERIQRFARAQESTRELIDLNNLVLDLLKLVGSDARLHDIELTLDLADGLPELYADPVQVQQVLLNLIRNGIDAMNEIGCKHGRVINIGTGLSGPDHVGLTVTDLGPGVSDDQVDLLFTPFHTTKKEGMGMGLSICRSIVSEHGGELCFRNNPGHGASFYFTLQSNHD